MEAELYRITNASQFIFLLVFCISFSGFIVCILSFCHNKGKRREDLVRDLKPITHMTISSQDAVPVETKCLELGGRGEIMDDNIYN